MFVPQTHLQSYLKVIPPNRLFLRAVFFRFSAGTYSGKNPFLPAAGVNGSLKSLAFRFK